ncbi:hypothetical protein [Nocardia sp. bgisy118]|uniref:hypothetical protein n=1 Tax=Nocardia sp. bgisy118 TaxID=3413786 RepID=UPI003F4A61D5
MYFDGGAAAGLEGGFWMTAIGLAIGVLSGVLVTTFYDQKGLTRTSRTQVETVQPLPCRSARSSRSA